MKKHIWQTILMAVVAGFLASCMGSTKPAPEEPIGVVPPEENTPVLTQCKDPRPEMCTAQYMPVCAYRDETPACPPGMMCPPYIRLVKKTYSNSCTACSDPKVRNYTEGECA